METYVDRMTAERDELNERISRLENFMDSGMSQYITTSEHIRQVKQFRAMLDYRDALNERIKNAPKNLHLTKTVDAAMQEYANEKGKE